MHVETYSYGSYLKYIYICTHEIKWSCFLTDRQCFFLTPQAVRQSPVPGMGHLFLTSSVDTPNIAIAFGFSLELDGKPYFQRCGEVQLVPTWRLCSTNQFLQFCMVLCAILRREVINIFTLQWTLCYIILLARYVSSVSAVIVKQLSWG